MNQARLDFRKMSFVILRQTVFMGGVYSRGLLFLRSPFRLYVIHQTFIRFWFLLLILLKNQRNLFIFCINVDIDEILLLKENKGPGFNSFRVISLCYS